MRKPIPLGTVVHNLVVIAWGPTVAGEVQHVCTCACGRTVTRAHSTLRRGDQHSCGCKRKPSPPRPRTLFAKGYASGRLTVIRADVLASPKNIDDVVYECRCACGNTFTASHGAIRNEMTKSCGCLRKETAASTSVAVAKKRGSRVSSFKSAPRELYRRYKKGASTRGHAFELSYDECVALFSKPCHYCGSAPVMTVRPIGQYNTQPVFRANGIDRMDNAQGYTKKNSVPCCPTCNHLKSDRDLTAWIRHMKKIIAHYEKRA